MGITFKWILLDHISRQNPYQEPGFLQMAGDRFTHHAGRA
jgi:hypothetical protein